MRTPQAAYSGSSSVTTGGVTAPLWALRLIAQGSTGASKGRLRPDRRRREPRVKPPSVQQGHNRRSVSSPVTFKYRLIDGCEHVCVLSALGSRERPDFIEAVVG